MESKVDILLHPVRIKIIQVLLGNKESGLTPLAMVKLIKDVPQATLYRHIQVLLEAGVIRILKEKKVRSVSEKYYVLNEEEAHLSSDEWNNVSADDKINYYSYYQLSLLNQYENYIKRLEEKGCSNDGSTFSILELKLDDEKFQDFQNDFQNLMMKYYKDSNEDTNQKGVSRTIGITIIPRS